MNSYYANLIHRTELVLGHDSMVKIESARVIIFGVGGVGSWCAEALVRSGIVNLTIVDSDIVCETNINRQAEALSSTVGNIKVVEMQKRLLDINPFANICAINKPFMKETAEEFNLDTYDYVIDAIDSLQHKCFLIQTCLEKKIKIVSSMGAGAKTDPSLIKTDLLERTFNCSLARAVRQRLKKNKVSSRFLCVFSTELPVKPQAIAMCSNGNCACACDRKKINDESAFNEKTELQAVDWCAQKKQINGAMVHITGIFGFTIASCILNDISGKKKIPVKK